MPKIEEIHIELGTDHSDAFLDALGLHPSTPSLARDTEAVRDDGRPSRTETEVLQSAAGDVVVITIAGAGLARALAPIVVEHLRTKKRGLRITRRDGSSIELQGNFKLDEMERILDATTADRPAPPVQD